MQSQRKRKSVLAGRQLSRRRNAFDQEALLWDEVSPVGREFGSPDFDRLMAEDRRDGVGVFDPALKQLFSKSRPTEIALPAR